MRRMRNMTYKDAIVASAGATAALLAGAAIWLMTSSDESASGLLVFGASLSVLSVAGVLARGEHPVQLPPLPSGRAIAIAAIAVAGVGILAAIAINKDDSIPSQAVVNNPADSRSISGDPVANDADRRRELQAISDALAEYHRVHGSYPSTANNVQTACNYPIDKLCQLMPALGKDGFLDPRGSPDRFGYWYKSDGSSFILFASMESEVGADNSCPDERHLRDERVQNVFCLRNP
jgi:hypothetical protein